MSGGRWCEIKFASNIEDGQEDKHMCVSDVDHVK